MFKFLFPKAKNKNNLEFHLSTVNKSKLQDITNRFSDFDPHPGASKYLDIAAWIPKFINHAQHLGLESKKSFNILDIGTGPGLFPLVCKNLGHQVRAIDLPDNPLYNEMISLFNIQRRSSAVRPFLNIPAFDTKFDLITGFAICFNGHATDTLWRKEEWGYFINDLKNNHLKKNGKIFLELNQEPNGLYYSQELLTFFKETGATFINNHVTYQF